MVPKESMDVTSNKSFIHVFHKAAKYSLQHDKSEFTNRNKKKCAQPKKPTTHTHQKKPNPKLLIVRHPDVLLKIRAPPLLALLLQL